MISRKSALAVGLGALFPLALFLLRWATELPLGDSDRFYHLALSRELASASAWFLRALPQLPALGWDSSFPDKEFLFHVLTSAGFRAGGEAGVQAAVLLAAAGGALALYAIALRELAPLPAFGVVVAAYFSHAFVLRMLFLRPHVLAVLCFLLLNLGILRRSAWLTAVAAAAFFLSYHAFYIPFACLSLTAFLALLGPVEERRSLLRAAAAGLFGSVAGALANPYFPGSAQMSLLVARIPFLMHGDLRNIGFGMELFPLSSHGFLQYYWLPLSVFIGGIFLLGRGEGRAGRSFSLAYPLALTAVCLWMASRSVRGGEYLFPASGVLLTALLARLPPRRRAWIALPAAVQALLLAWVFQQEGRKNPDARDASAVFAAMGRLPGRPGAVVFNCEWERGAFLFYARPDLRFVTALDPSLLYFRDSRLFAEQMLLRSGLSPDPRSALRRFFGADYVLCRAGPMTEQLRLDPSFQQLYPAGGDAAAGLGSHFLFRIRDREPAEAVRSFTLERVWPETPAAARSLAPPSRWPEGAETVALRDSSYLDLSASGPGDGGEASPGRPSCAFLSPSPSEVSRLAGASYLGLGGRLALRLWRNGQLLFASGTAWDRPLSVNALVPLPRPLRPGDSLLLLVCAPGDGGGWGLSLSAWSAQALAETCAWKREGAGAPPREGEGAALAIRPRSCLAELAVPRAAAEGLWDR